MTLFKRCPCKGRERDACAHPWWTAFEVRGKRFRISLEKHFSRKVRGRGSKTLARELEGRLKAEAKATGSVSLLNSPSSPRPATFAAFLTLYQVEYCEAKGLRSWGSDRKWKLGKVAKVWGERPLTAIASKDVEAFFSALRAEGAAPATLRRYYAHLRHAFGWAERRKLIERSPVRDAHVELPKEENERTRRLEQHEERALFAVADPFLRDAMIVTLATCVRRRTLLALQRKHISLERSTLTLPSSLLKGKRPLVLPLTRRAKGALARRLRVLPDSPDAFIFGDEAGNAFKGPTPLTRRWYEALEKAGLRHANLWWHDLRGEGASRLAEMRVSIDVIRRLLGHTTLAMTQRYLRARVGQLAEVVEALERWGR